MKWIALLLVAAVALVCVATARGPTSQLADEAAAAIAFRSEAGTYKPRAHG